MGGNHVFRINNNRSSRDTSIMDFGIGILLMIVGLISIFKNTSVGVFWVSRLFGTSLPSGIITIPIIIAIVMIVLNHKSRMGWILMVVGVVLLLLNLICSVRIIFNTTSLFSYLLMFGGTFGGMALIARALLRK